MKSFIAGKETGVGRKTRGVFFAGILLFLLFAGACASRPYVQKEEKVFDLIKAINNGEAAERSLAEAPFLFDGEIVYLQNVLSGLWRNLHAAGFRLADAAIVRNQLLTENSWREFGDTFDVESFFKKYLDKNTSLVEIKARGGTYLFLLNKEKDGYPVIQGFKGGLLVK
ncbi:MAG: hypothetical protein FWG35_04995 [Spirochaetaceae bacterium]|nr:hypothetical protein [Spirochaetaceae bacterium]